MAANGEHFSFWKGAEQLFGEDDFDRSDAVRVVKGHMADALGARHLSFLLGSGCSSFKRAGDELGIPTMGPIFHCIYTFLHDRFLAGSLRRTSSASSRASASIAVRQEGRGEAPIGTGYENV